MITIALDEQGGFEKGQTTNEAIFIAGILYDDKGDASDTANERRRLEEYYKKVCESAGTTYPIDLHYDSNENNDNREGMQFWKCWCLNHELY